jgi:hypothetical protein
MSAELSSMFAEVKKERGLIIRSAIKNQLARKKDFPLTTMLVEGKLAISQGVIVNYGWPEKVGPMFPGDSGRALILIPLGLFRAESIKIPPTPDSSGGHYPNRETMTEASIEDYLNFGEKSWKLYMQAAKLQP